MKLKEIPDAEFLARAVRAQSKTGKLMIRLLDLRRLAGKFKAISLGWIHKGFESICQWLMPDGSIFKASRQLRDRFGGNDLMVVIS